MGKNKVTKKQKVDAVFKVAGNRALKAKRKTKSVTSNLKKLNHQTREQVSKSDDKLKTLQKAISSVTAESTSQVGKGNVKARKVQEPEPISMDETVVNLQKL